MNASDRTSEIERCGAFSTTYAQMGKASAEIPINSQGIWANQPLKAPRLSAASRASPGNKGYASDAVTAGVPSGAVKIEAPRNLKVAYFVDKSAVRIAPMVVRNNRSFWLFFFRGLLRLVAHGDIATRNGSLVERSSATHQFLVIASRFRKHSLAQFFPFQGGLLEEEVKVLDGPIEGHRVHRNAT